MGPPTLNHMGGLAERLYSAIARIRDPATGAPAAPLHYTVTIEERGDGTIIIIITPRDPYSATALTYAEAIKTIASKVEGVKQVIIECRNHIMADLINMRLNQQR
jgi:hypothetical protein